MSEESTPTQENLAGIEPADAPKKATRKRAAKKAATKKTAAKKTTRKRAAKKVAASLDEAPPPKESAEPKEVSSPRKKSAPVKREKPQAKDNSDDDVSFSFDPSDIKEPDEKPGKTQDKPSGNDQGSEPKERQGNDHQSSGDHQHGDHHQGGQHNKQHYNKNKNFNKNKKFNKNKQHPNQQRGGQHPNQQKQQQNKKQKPQKQKQQQPKQRRKRPVDTIQLPDPANLYQDEVIKSLEALAERAQEAASGGGEALHLPDYYTLPIGELVRAAEEMGIVLNSAPNRRMLLQKMIDTAAEAKRPITDFGLLWVTEDEGSYVLHEHTNYVPRSEDYFMPEIFVKKFGLKTGHMVKVQIVPQEGEGCAYVVALDTVNDLEPESIAGIVPFEDLIPYYPTERILMEVPPEDIKKQDVSMRVVDALTPVGFGQRGLIVAPPRTGKTVLLQGIANSLAANNPDATLIVLLIDERPEEVTDFRRLVKGEVIASTFDEAADNHVQVAEMVIEKARRMVECGKDVIILLDSITRLARGYNTMMPNTGKILSGGVEAGALQKPKRFFGSARNIEEGGSLTILGTALIETGSKMDEVVFEEFKGTGNMELHLDRQLSDKRIFPAINLEKSGTRKEELLYHPDEMNRIYSLRRAMKGVPGTEAMEMLITRMKKTTTNVEFLMQVNR